MDRAIRDFGIHYDRLPPLNVKWLSIYHRAARLDNRVLEIILYISFILYILVEESSAGDDLKTKWTQLGPYTLVW